MSAGKLEPCADEQAAFDAIYGKPAPSAPPQPVPAGMEVGERKAADLALAKLGLGMADDLSQGHWSIGDAVSMIQGLAERLSNSQSEADARIAELERACAHADDMARGYAEDLAAAEAKVAELEARLGEALDRVKYVPGDHPVVPIKHDAFVKEIASIYAFLATVEKAG